MSSLQKPDNHWGVTVYLVALWHQLWQDRGWCDGWRDLLPTQWQKVEAPLGPTNARWQPTWQEAATFGEAWFAGSSWCDWQLSGWEVFHFDNELGGFLCSQKKHRRSRSAVVTVTVEDREDIPQSTKHPDRHQRHNSTPANKKRAMKKYHSETHRNETGEKHQGLLENKYRNCLEDTMWYSPWKTVR